MLYPRLEERLNHARGALKGASSANIIDLCKQYLGLLAEYRIKLYALKDPFGIRQRPVFLPSKDLAYMRKAIRTAIEYSTRERNRTETLLRSFTVSGYEAVEIFNRRKYRGCEDWELRASGVKSRGSPAQDLLTIKQAVEIAGLLRREEHAARSAVPAFKGKSSWIPRRKAGS